VEEISITESVTVDSFGEDDLRAGREGEDGGATEENHQGDPEVDAGTCAWNICGSI